MVTCKRGTAPPSGACPRNSAGPCRAVNAGNRTPLQTRPARVSKWRQRFARKRLAGLSDAQRKGKPKTYDQATEKRILSLLDTVPPSGYSQWNGRLLSQSLADVSDDQVWRALRKHKIQLQRRGRWCIPTDPEFARKAADIVALYLHPPEHAVVVCVDEKPHIQMLKRAQGWLRLRNGKAVNGFTSRYKRHGTTTLFAALEVAAGQVCPGHCPRRRRRQFLNFMTGVVAAHAGKALHVILAQSECAQAQARSLWRDTRKCSFTALLPTCLG